MLPSSGEGGLRRTSIPAAIAVFTTPVIHGQTNLCNLLNSGLLF
jgi:hypothetical protein